MNILARPIVARVLSLEALNIEWPKNKRKKNRNRLSTTRKISIQRK